MMAPITVKSRTILIASFSKTFCMAGWRAGAIAAPKAVMQAISNLQSHTASNACNLVQYAALAALEPENEAFIATVREQLRVQRSVALDRLGKIAGVTCVVPEGAFYVFADISGLLNKTIHGQRLDNVDVLAEMLLEHAHIAVVPGSAFGIYSLVRVLATGNRTSVVRREM